MTSDLLTNRIERYRFELLDNTNRSLGNLDGVTDLTINDGGETIRLSGSATIVNATAIDWLKHRIRPIYLLGEQSVIIDSVPVLAGRREEKLGVFLVRTPTKSHSDGIVTQSLELYDATQALAEFKVEETWALAAGDALIPAARALISQVGELPAVLSDSAAVAAKNMSWDADTDALTILTAILAAAGFAKPYTDTEGRLRAELWVDPKLRPVEWEFVDGEDGVYSPDFTETRDDWDVPNKYVCISATDGDVPASRTEVTDTSDASPFSYQNRGHRWITTTDRDVDAADITALESICAQRMAKAQAPGVTFEIRHLWVPIRSDSVVTFKHSSMPAPVRCTITKTTMSTGDVCSSTLQQVI